MGRVKDIVPLPPSSTSSLTLTKTTETVMTTTVERNREGARMNNNMENVITDQKVHHYCDTQVSMGKMVDTLDVCHLSGVGMANISPILETMDICACVSAERVARGPCVTKSVDEIIFRDRRLQPGELVSVRSQVNK